MPNEEICLKESTPVGTLGIIPLESCKELGAKVNNYLVNWRQDRDAEHYDHITLAGYKSDSYIVKAAVPRFGSGEAKGSILQSVRGLDIFLIVDVTNYSLTYSLCGQTNHMSPDDHYSDLKRIIAAIEGKAKRIMKTSDVIIVGSGASGLFNALFLPQDYKVIVITKKEVEESDSFLAQGGISALKNPEDYDSYFEDTMKAGHYENDKGAVEKMIKESPQIIQDLKDFGVRFDLKDGEIEFTREGGHSTFRILHHEDLTGKEITSHLYEEAKKRDNITIMENCTMIDIIEKDGECKGIVYKDADGNLDTIEAPDTVLATGGLGGLFKHSTNFRHLTADSLAICLRHNVELENINYIQIHPTTFYSKKPGRRFLISESVRGEGAYLLNKDGERFTDELKPRDVVTGEICKQMKKDGSDHVYLTVTHLDGERIKHRFPNIYKQCLDEGYDMTKEPIPVTPAQHYFMGGIKVNLDSKTSMEHLYAVGETSCNGVHGKNRLASNSLLEALVFAKAAAKDITEHPSKAETVEVDLSKYQNEEQREKENEQLVLDEIKRKDRSFYDQWCNDEN